jgi:hypothetical protein
VADGYPRKYSREAAPAAVIELVHRLMPLLLEGDDPLLAVLREQYGRSTITEIEMTGHGIYAEFDVPADTPRTDPPSIAGGDAVIELDTAPNGAGCVVFVSDGRLWTFEGYTYDGEWTETTKVIGVGDVTPLKWK